MEENKAIRKLLPSETPSVPMPMPSGIKLNSMDFNQRRPSAGNEVVSIRPNEGSNGESSDRDSVACD
jgi:hypothetical protein